MALKMIVICVSIIILFVLDVSQSMDGCKYQAKDWGEYGNEFWRCGTQCLFADGDCKCGNTTFGYKDGKWCCPNKGEECDIDGKHDRYGYPNHVTCKSATPLNLTQ